MGKSLGAGAHDFDFGFVYLSTIDAVFELTANDADS